MTLLRKIESHKRKTALMQSETEQGSETCAKKLLFGLIKTSTQTFKPAGTAVVLAKRCR